jgi:hypothetical protein
MNFEFDFFGIDRLFSIPIEKTPSQGSDPELSELNDWIIVSLQTTKKSWLLLQLNRQDWLDDSAALEIANIIAARRIAECDGLSLGTPSWMSELQKRQILEWVHLASDSGEGLWAKGQFPRFRWYIVNDKRPTGEQ